METRDILYILCGYLCGSVLFARVFGRLLGHCDVAAESDDNNPGAANAFKYGGFLCGLLTLVFDINSGAERQSPSSSASFWDFSRCL